MTANDIMAIIRRRRNEADDRQIGKSSAGLLAEAQIDWCIREEYDALLNEIEQVSAHDPGAG